MYLKATLILILGLYTCLNLHSQTVPAQIEYCGMTLHLAPPVQKQISEYISQIHKSPRFFNEMVRRAQLYMPLIDQAFRDGRVPEDLKYLAIQESGLRPSVVSSSQAVGFWQFKAPTALDMGLQVNEKIDERQHIYRASQAAAKYFSKANWDYDNWVYAVVAYYEGPTGSVKHTDPQYYGEDTMKIESGFHWYALKAIAHKLAYEDAIKNQIRSGIWLETHNTQGETSIRQLIANHDVEADLFLEHNPWILDEKRLPKSGTYIYFVPQEGRWNQVQSEAVTATTAAEEPIPLIITDMGSEEEIVNQNSSSANPPSSSTMISDQEAPEADVPQPPKTNIATASIIETIPATPPSIYPKANPVLPQNSAGYVVFDLSQDLHYNQLYIHFDGSQTITQIADAHDKRLSQLLVWNGLMPGQEPRLGSMVYLMKPSKQEYHIVRHGESLEDISRLHLISPRKLQKLNHLKKHQREIYVGQKLYIKKRKPSKEKMIILAAPEIDSKPAAPIVEQIDTPSAAQIDPPKQGTTSYPAQEPEELEVIDTQAQPATPTPPTVQEVKTRWITHKVKPGETLWQISKRYDTKVEIIKMINKMQTDSISEGQMLRILAKDGVGVSGRK